MTNREYHHLYDGLDQREPGYMAGWWDREYAYREYRRWSLRWLTGQVFTAGFFAAVLLMAAVRVAWMVWHG